MQCLLVLTTVVVMLTHHQGIFVSCEEEDNAGSDVKHDGSWSYVPGPTCPMHWPSLFPNCAKGRQSPIDINTETAKYNDKLNDINMIPISTKNVWNLGNNGHAVYLSSEDEIHIEGAGLNDVYQVLGPHFHWGNSTDHGSEHTFDNGKAYPLEMHIVTYNRERYDDASQAIASGDGNALAVFGILFTVGAENNTKYQPIIENLQKVRIAKSPEAPVNVSLQDLLPKLTSNYYRYLGSLTTPQCHEIVIWTLFEEKIFLSEYQLNEFRKVLDEQNRPLVNNYRPVQNLNGRQVLKSFQAPGYKLDDVQDNDGNGAGRPAGYFIALFVSVLSAVFKTMC